MNTQRRTFRGRGGPTDRRLPKHNARRRHAPGQQPHKPATNKYQEEDDDDVRNEVGNGNVTDENSMENIDSPNDESIHEASLGSEIASGDILPSDEIASITNENTTEEDTKQVNPCAKEVRHLKNRVRNIRETMQLSNSISNPTTYQGNVLNAVVNCVNEWRSIVTHYPPIPADSALQECDKIYLNDEIKKPAALAVFEMIQQAIQCGPLAGAKPGYFKRCGGEMARVAHSFLDEVIPHSPLLIQLMGFTTKQMEAMETWRKNAQKAVIENKPPSRTAVKHQEGKGTGKKAKKKNKP